MPEDKRSLDYEIPILEPASSRGSPSRIPVDTSDPHYHEPLVDLKTVGVAYDCYHARTNGSNPPYHRCVEGSRKDVWLRKTVAEKLGRANQALRPFGVELLVLDGYRSVKCQWGMWEFYCEKAKRDLANPSEDECIAFALNFLSDPRAFDPCDSSTWPQHATGAAVDLTLCDLSTGVPVDMGSNYEEITEISNTDYFERQLARGMIAGDDPRLLNRRLLHWSMSREGMVNITTFVYWHYDWGNQLYVLTGKPYVDVPNAAWYGYIPPPPEAS